MSKTNNFTDDEWNQIDKALENMNNKLNKNNKGSEFSSMDELFNSVKQEAKQVKPSGSDNNTSILKRINIIGNMLKDSSNKLTIIFNGLTTINNKIDIMYNELGFRSKDQTIKDFYKLGIKSVVPDLTPKQLYSMKQLGWTANELAAISGYSIEQVIVKVNSYSNSLSNRVLNGGKK